METSLKRCNYITIKKLVSFFFLVGVIHGGTDGTNNLFIIPRMLDTSDECLVMEYEPSQSIIGDERNKIDKHVLLRFLYLLLDFTLITVMHGLVHADLHMGNYGIRNPETPETMRIVLYDFGHMYDIRDLTPEMRINILIYNTLYDFTNASRCVIDDTYHYDKLLYLVSDHNETGNKVHYQQNAKQMISYITINNIKVNNSVFKALTFMEKTASCMNLVNEIETDPEYRHMYNELRKSTLSYYFDTYVSYDDMKILNEKLGHLRIR